MKTKRLDTFTLSYVETLLWSELDDNEDPLDDNYTIEDIDLDALDEIINDCNDFQNKMLKKYTEEKLDAARLVKSYAMLEQSGHDFCLTRNSHGAGFWDGDWSKPIGRELTKLSESFGSQHLYVGDDGKLYVE